MPGRGLICSLEHPVSDANLMSHTIVTETKLPVDHSLVRCVIRR